MITGLNHANISTAKLQETIDFFVGVIGLRVGPRPDFNFPGAWLYAGNQAVIHLVERAQTTRCLNGALDHISFTAPDFDAALRAPRPARHSLPLVPHPERLRPSVLRERPQRRHHRTHRSRQPDACPHVTTRRLRFAALSFRERQSPCREETAMKLDSSISAIVTGGASGLGGATVKALRAHGVKVAIFDMNEKTGTAFAAETGAVYCNVNVTDDASVDAGFAAARAANGQERILVNCAGTGIAVKTAGRKKETGEISAHPLDALQQDHPDQPGRHVPLHRQIRRRHADARRHWPTETVAPSSTPPPSPPRMARSARPPTRLRKAASSA